MKKTMVISIILSMLQFMSSCTPEGASLGIALVTGGSGDGIESNFDPNCSGITTRDTLYTSEAGQDYFSYEALSTLTLKNEEGELLNFQYQGADATIEILNLEIFCSNAEYHSEQTFTHAQQMVHYFDGELPSGEGISVRCSIRKSKQEIEPEKFAYYELLSVTLNTVDAYNTYLDMPQISEFTWYDETIFNDTNEIKKEEKGTLVERIELNGQTFNNVRYIINSQNYGIYTNAEQGIIAVQTPREGLFVII